MALLQKLFFLLFLMLCAAIDGTLGDTIVFGAVFCDQCKDGRRSMFDYPVYGIKVTMSCSDSNGQIINSREETTNWFGNYAVRLDGAPDLSPCHAQVSGSGWGSMDCGSPAGPAQALSLVFRMFDTYIYRVEPLLAQPAQPMPFCLRSSNPVSSPVIPCKPPSPPFRLPPPVRVPPFPPSPPLQPLRPPVPLLQASACPHENWTMPEYRCYWKVMKPETKVAVAFGMIAARRYGTNMTLWQGLHGRGEAYRSLLREGITALLNSYNSLQFPYNTSSVIQHFNWALMGTRKYVIHTALRFKRANSDDGHLRCKFTTRCK